MRVPDIALRTAKFLVVILAPVLLYLGLRDRGGVSTEVALWATVPWRGDAGKYQPRTAVFDGARRRIATGGARGETVRLEIRLHTSRLLAAAALEFSDLRSRYQDRAAVAFRTYRVLDADVVTADKVAVPAAGTLRWLVEARIAKEAKPGLYGGAIRVLDGGDRIATLALRFRIYPFAIGPPPLRLVTAGAPPRERALLQSLGFTDAAQAKGSAARTLPAKGDPRSVLWAAFADKQQEMDAGPFERWIARRDGVPNPTVRALQVHRALQDLSVLQRLLGRGEPMARQILARVTQDASPGAAIRWEQIRRQMAGLMSAPGSTP